MKNKTKIKISVYWPDDWKSVILTQAEYKSIQDGNSIEKDGEGYYYEGEYFSDYWTFNEEGSSEVMVSYGYDKCVGFDGALSDCEIEEIE